MMRYATFRVLILGLLLLGWVTSAYPVQAQAGSAQALINLVNQVRTANGLPALIVDPILMATAQATAETMASNGICAHIGNVSGRVAAAGYGGGATVFATENISCGYNRTVEQVVYQDWADASHMLPMTNANYVHVGAGVVETGDGRIYYVLHAAYFAGAASGYTPRAPASGASGATTPQIIIPVQTATPQADGSIIHKVQPGQSAWSIAIAYGVKIADLIALNHLAPTPILWAGQDLIVRPSFTPTLSPTVTPTVPPPTRTPTPSPTPRTPTPTRTPTSTPTPTPRPWVLTNVLNNPDQRHNLGWGLLILSALGLAVVIGSSLRGRK